MWFRNELSSLAEVSLYLTRKLDHVVTSTVILCGLFFRLRNACDNFEITCIRRFLLPFSTVQGQSKNNLLYIGLLSSHVFRPSTRIVFRFACLFVFYGAAAQRGPWPPHSWGFLITHNDASQSVGLLWTSDQPVAETSTWQHKTLNRDRHPCQRWDSNSQSEQASGHRRTP